MQSAEDVFKIDGFLFFSEFVILLSFFFFSPLHRNSPTFKSFEEKVENLKASREVNKFFLLSCLEA